MTKGQLVAKVKFWFGKDLHIFNEQDFVIESQPESDFVYIYKKVKQ